ncbi:Uncharacterised protein [Candidatus Anstonella stagnisolia]|nr:Uncharacterised protein [Candidatus Anstonella stagnisolia]
MLLVIVMVNKTEKPEMAEENAMENFEYIEVKHMGDLWDIDFKGRGKRTLFKGDTVKLNLHDKVDLNVILSIIKETNAGRINKMQQVKKDGGQVTVTYIPRFEIIAGKDLLPKCLQEYRYSASNMMTDIERAAVLKLCPTFYKKE